MSDFYFTVDVLRDQMSDQLAGNTEQTAYVIAATMDKVTCDEVVEYGSLPNDIDKDLVVGNLRMLADAIEQGKIL